MIFNRFEKWISVSESIAFDPDARYPDPTFGFQLGTVDSGKASPGGENGNWGGSMTRALWFAYNANLFMQKNYGKSNVVSSQKRTRLLTASGNVSDHFEGVGSAYAVDLSCSGEQGDALLAHLMQLFGHPEYKGGSWFNVTKNGYRYQIGWKVKNHIDHIHVGVKKTIVEKIKGVAQSFAKNVASNPKFIEWSKKNLSGVPTESEIEIALEKPGGRGKKWFMETFGLSEDGLPAAVKGLSSTAKIRSSYSDAEKAKLNKDIESMVNKLPEFDSIDTAKKKINEFVS
jgi:hypothetical protein